MKNEILFQEMRQAIPSCTAWPEPRMVRNDSPKDGHSRARCIQGCRGCWHRLQSKAMQNPKSKIQNPPPHHLEAPGRGPGGCCRPPATHCEPVTLHHFIKLLINLFIFLLRLRGQSKHFVPLGALALPVLLVQRLLRVGDTGGSRDRARGGRTEEKQNRKEHIMKDFQPRAATYTVSLEQDIQILAAFAVFILHQGALVYGVVAVGLWAVTAVKTFLS